MGWDYIDVIIFSGDAFVDHPSFGTAVIARYLQRAGYRVAVVPQPNWRDDLRDFRKLGAPRLYFGVNAGAMDSMVNHYTASKRLRSDDAYTPGGRAGQRPDYTVTVYTGILKRLYPDIPVVIGGIEASLRRLTHYDYWKDDLLPSVLVTSGADWLCYGMGERPMLELTRAIEAERNLSDIRKIPQLAFYMTGRSREKDALVLHSYEECRRDGRAFAENFHLIETHANMMHPSVMIEPVGDGHVHVNPPYPPATQEEMDSFWDLPYTKLPHPRYKGKRIPHDPAFRHDPQGLFRRLQFLHYSRPSGEVHPVKVGGFHNQGDRGSARSAGFLRERLGSRCAYRQHVRNEGPGSGIVREVRPQVMPFPVSVQEHEPLA